ncbi:YbaB/EbfC family nucleoid-associated protein [Patescibacteria group bacterium]|nr:YbaB/EbfC family nucleoid-associated protein [Patescibacteria group bacterium]MBU4512178.1 YbaB/EbfC family nucleoid-associated protein [Patescibacteria group bacterium]MCG2693485.1 YbaB/EbfC family nucleoid-associated protein [Candidatus Parcubacteria bacterium]
MFNPLQMLKQAKEIKKELDQTQVTGTSANQKITIVLNGNQEIVSIDAVKPNDFQDKDELTNSIHEAFNDALEQVKKKIVERFQGRIPM